MVQKRCRGTYFDSLETEILAISLSGDGRVFCLVWFALEHMVVPDTGQLIQVSGIEDTEAQASVECLSLC